MKEKIKSWLKVIFSALGIVAIFDWVIAPGLKSESVIINIFSFLFAGVVSTIFGVLLWNKVTDVEEDEEKNG